MRTTPTALRRIGASAVAAAALVAAGAVLIVPAFANHTAPNGSVRTGPDLVFLDCLAPGRTTSRPDPAPATDPTGQRAQSAATGSGCTAQASTRTSARPAAAHTLRARFTFNSQTVAGRVIQFSITDDTTADGATLTNPQLVGPSNLASSPSVQYCTTGNGSNGQPDGECTVQVFATTPGFVTVTGRERDSLESATETIEFRNNNNALGRFDETHRVVVKPNEDDYTGFNCEGAAGDNPYSGTGGTAGSGTASGGNGCPNGTTRAPSGTPGRPVQVSYQLLDEGSAASGSFIDVAQDPNRAAFGPRPLANRTISLSLSNVLPPGSNDDFFFTPNCGPVTFSSGSLAPNAPDYRQCRFRNGPNDGSVAGLLTDLGPTINVTSDENGLVTVTVAVEDAPNFANDGVAGVQVQATPQAGQGATRNATETNSNEVSTAAPLNYNTRNRPLNGVRLTIDQYPGGAILAAGSDLPGQPQPQPASPVTGFRRTFRPITATSPALLLARDEEQRFTVSLRDQFDNLVRVPETDVTVSASGTNISFFRECTTGGTGFSNSACTNPAAANTNFNAAGPQTSPGGAAGNPITGSKESQRTTGSYKTGSQGTQGSPTNFQHEDTFRVSNIGTSATNVVLSATWQAPLTVFNGGGTGGTASPTTSSTATPTSTPTATPTSTSTPTATPTSTSTPTPTATPTSTSTPTATPTGQPSRFASRVSLVSSHSRVTAGNGPRLSGQVFDQNGQPLGGVNLTFFEKSFGESFYSQTPSGSVTSGFDGRFSLVVRPTTQTSYGANTDDGRANSNIVQVRVNARMDITSPAPSALVSNPVTLSGRILPAYNNRLIGLAYINSRGSYVFLGQSPTRDGAFSVRSGGRVPSGTYTFVVYMSPTQGTDRGARSLRLTVR